MNAKPCTVTIVVELAPADRRAIAYKRLTALYGVPSKEAAREATAVSRGTAHDHLAALLRQEIDRLTFEYLDIKKRATR